MDLTSISLDSSDRFCGKERFPLRIQGFLCGAVMRSCYGYHSMRRRQPAMREKDIWVMGGGGDSKGLRYRARIDRMVQERESAGRRWHREDTSFDTACLMCGINGDIVL